MRLKLELECKPNATLGLNYMYALQAVIYKVLERADPEFSQWLHNKGYDATGKNFKFFTFDILDTPERDRHIDKIKNTIRFINGRITWQVSFCVDEQMEKFVIGLFKNQKLEVVTSDGRADFTVVGVEILEKPVFTSTMRFRTYTPICIAEKTETDKYQQYRSPLDVNFEKYFFANLENKFKTLNAITSTGDANEVLLKPIFKLLSKPYSKKISVFKKDNPKPTDTIGYEFDFEITALPEFLRIGYFAGFGVKNSSGFGFCEILKNGKI